MIEGAQVVTNLPGPGTKTVVNGDGEEEEVQMLGDKSGINPSFAVECDQDLGMCVLSKSLPAYE